MNLQESVDKIVASETIVANRFYELFFERCPEVRPMFEKVNLTTQAVMLTMALKAIREHPNISNASKMYLQVLGTRHQRAEIPKDLYPAFMESLLATLREFHADEWDDPLEQQWRGAFEAATELMYEGYEKRFHI